MKTINRQIQDQETSNKRNSKRRKTIKIHKNTFLSNCYKPMMKKIKTSQKKKKLNTGKQGLVRQNDYKYRPKGRKTFLMLKTKKISNDNSIPEKIFFNTMKVK